MQKIHADIIFQTVDPITDVYVGVPDSLLKNFLNKVENCGKKHIICANEAHAVSIAFGMMMAGKKPCVYLQNSGLGNIINPLTSLCIPCDIQPCLVVGHRHTLPQHKVMGDCDDAILHIIGYNNYYLIEGSNNVK
jgi:phosphonopyruvate decarboxylase